MLTRCRVLGFGPVSEKGSEDGCDAGVHHPSNTDRTEFLAPLLTGWTSISSPHHASMLQPGSRHAGCTQAAETDRHSSPADHRSVCHHANMPQPDMLGCWDAVMHPSSTNRPACRNRRFLHAGLHQQNRQTGILRRLTTNQHAIRPACYNRGACMSVLMGCAPSCQHAATAGAGVLECTPAG